MLHWSQNFRLLVYRFRKKFKTWNINMLHFRLLFKNQKLIFWKYNISLTFPWFILWPHSVASIGGAARPRWHRFGMTPFGVKYIIITALICGEYLALISNLIWTKNPLVLWRRPFFFLVFNYFWTENRWHHVIPPRVPPFLATPLALFPYFFSPSFLGSELHIYT